MSRVPWHGRNTDKDSRRLQADRIEGLHARALICANHAKSRESITWLSSPQLAQSVSMPSDPPSHRGLLELWRQCCYLAAGPDTARIGSNARIPLSPKSAVEQDDQS